MKKILYRAAVLVLTLTLLGSGGYLIWKQIDYSKGAADYAEAVKQAAVPPLRPVPLPAPGEPDPPPDPNPGLLAEADLEALRETNSDVVAWIAIPGTTVSYPVVQCGNNQYYLNHTWQKQRSAVGAIFMEYTCPSDFSGFNITLYGHRMNNDSMFGILHSYREEDFWREHPTVYLATDSGVRAYDVYAAFEVSVRDIIYRLDVEENGWQQDFIDFGLAHSVLDAGVTPSPDGQILTLSTCTGRSHNTRWVVQAVLQEEETPPPAESAG